MHFIHDDDEDKDKEKRTTVTVKSNTFHNDVEPNSDAECAQKLNACIRASCSAVQRYNEHQLGGYVDDDKPRSAPFPYHLGGA
jgi:hypothetical protein